MKKSLIICLFAFISLIGCKKKEDIQVDEIEHTEIKTPVFAHEAILTGNSCAGDGRRLFLINGFDDLPYPLDSIISSGIYGDFSFTQDIIALDMPDSLHNGDTITVDLENHAYIGYKFTETCNMDDSWYRVKVLNAAPKEG